MLPQFQGKSEEDKRRLVIGFASDGKTEETELDDEGYHNFSTTTNERTINY